MHRAYLSNFPILFCNFFWRQSSRMTLSFLQLILALFQRPTSLFITTTHHFSVMSTWTKHIARVTTSNAPYTVRRNPERGCSFAFVILHARYLAQSHATNTANCMTQSCRPGQYLFISRNPDHGYSDGHGLEIGVLQLLQCDNRVQVRVLKRFLV